jgi:signal transduction histidine kinase
MRGATHTASLIATFQEDLQALLEISPSLAAAFELDGTILALNDAMAAVLGEPNASLVGKDLFALLKEADQPLMDLVLQVAESRQPFTFDTLFRGRSLTCTLYPTVNPRGSVLRMLLVGMEVTERQRRTERIQVLTRELEHKVLERTAELEAANEQLSREKRQAELLVDFSRILVEYAHDYNGLLQHISERIAELVGDLCLVALLSEDRKVLKIAAIADRNSTTQAKMRSTLLGKSLAVEELALASRLLKGENYLEADLSHDEACRLTHPEFWSFVGREGLRSLAGIPLLVREKTLGGLFAVRDSDSPAPYDEGEFGFLQSIAGPLALTVENARLFEEVTDNRQQLRGLSKQLVDVQESQYKHLADELHDHIGQDLTAININLSLLETMLPAEASEELRERIQKTTKLVEESVARMRNIMADFRPPMLDSSGLRAALFWYAEKFSHQMNVPVEVHDQNMQGGRLPIDVETGLFRITQEALLNAAKHAKAKQIDIRLTEEAAAFTLTIEDDGRGFDPQQLPAGRGSHWGMAIMRERARAIGASIHIQSAPGQGTRVVLKYH